MADNEELLDEDDGGEYNIVAIVIAVVLVLAIIGGVIWYFFIRTPPQEDESVKLPEWEAPEQTDRELVFDLLPKVIVNPLDSEGRYYLQVKVDLTFNRDMRSELINKLWLIPQAQNIIIDVFSDYTIEELQTPKFKEEARNEIKGEFNRLLGWTEDKKKEKKPNTKEEEDPENLPPIKEVYLVEFILQ